MDKILIAGLDTLAGANIAAILKDRFELTGLCFEHPLQLKGADCQTCSPDDAAGITQLVRSLRPAWIIYCGQASIPSWHADAECGNPALLTQRAKTWSTVAGQTQTPLTVLSSDGIFTGPWMFHDDDSEKFCESTTAKAIRTMEREVRSACPQALIVRTQVFGWAPSEEIPSFAADTVEQLRANVEIPLDYLRHATPILATDLAEILEQAYVRRLAGTYHISGSERINPYRFSALLAEQFGLPCCISGTMEPVSTRAQMFGAGESSLTCRRIKGELGISLPMMLESIQRFHAQSLTDFCDQFAGGGRRSPRPMVA
ncbi:MAG: sugar nucleotide-binding protein [Planctomycetales bacterium]